MIDLQLDYDEGIVLQEKNVRIKTQQACDTREIVLTHKNLYYVYYHKRNIFSKNEAIIEKTSLADIKIVNGYVQVSLLDKGESECYLEIQYITKPIERFLFDVENNRSEALKWYNAINRMIIGNLYIDIVEPEKPKGISGMIGAITNNLKASFGLSNRRSNEVFVAPPQPIIKSESNFQIEPLEKKSVKTYKSEISHKNCPNCGERVDTNAKFCNNCGESLEKKNAVDKTPEQAPPPIPSYVATQTANTGKREQVYEGTVHKCPHCGEILKSFELNCPACNKELRGVQGSYAASELSRKLEYANSDKQRINIIKSFPIPNTKEDIFEFLILASTSFDVSRYISCLAEEDISDAWLSKIEQCYQKAKLLLENDAFLKVKEIYDKTISEINLEKRKVVNKSRRNDSRAVNTGANEPTVDDLKNRIFQLESSRKPKGLFGFVKLDPVDSQKLTLIKSYPLPDDLYEIRELMVYSISNIDIELSKNTLANRMSKSSGPDTNSTIDRSISDAWVTKVQQLYIKAKATYSDLDDVKLIEEMYFDIMGKLKIKVK